MNWTKKILLEIKYSKNWMKNIEISPRDSIKHDQFCPACKGSMKPFLTVVNQESTVLLEKRICSCGYCHFTTMPGKAWFEDFYNAQWDSAGQVPKEKMASAESSYHRNISWLTRFAPNLDASILDAGAGYGHFLQAARRSGYRNIQGIEPSAHRSEHCRANLNLDVTTEFIENCIEVFRSESGLKLFDVIYSNHVLEHVYDIDSALKNFYQMLKPGGLFVFVVPNWLQMESVVIMAHFLGHIRHFTPKAFVLLLQRHGFEVQHVDNDVSISIVGRKPIANERTIENEEFLEPLPSRLEELVEEKIAKELFGGDMRQFRKDNDRKQFFLASGANRSTYWHESDLRLRERIRWQAKRHIFGVCHNNKPIRGPGGNLLRVFNLRLLLIKFLTRILSYGPFELGGLITSKSVNKRGEEAPLVEFAYQEKVGVATIK
jgi:2-polyprenyl-3-methyl-5-hydroxy-6-metoxy-1,4-benzoquinol methylase